MPARSKLSRIRAMLDADPDAADRMLRLLASDVPTSAIRSADDAVAVLSPLLAGRETEALAVVALDRRNHVVDTTLLTTGSAGFTIVDPAQVYRWAMTRSRMVHAVILAHNHPSGDPTPSTQDVEVTTRVARAGSVLGVPLLDHIVVTDAGGYISMAARGDVPPSARWSVTTAW